MVSGDQQWHYSRRGKVTKSRTLKPDGERKLFYENLCLLSVPACMGERYRGDSTKSCCVYQRSLASYATMKVWHVIFHCGSYKPSALLGRISCDALVCVSVCLSACLLTNYLKWNEHYFRKSLLTSPGMQRLDFERNRSGL